MIPLGSPSLSIQNCLPGGGKFDEDICRVVTPAVHRTIFAELRRI
jgi:hypothetical protein